MEAIISNFGYVLEGFGTTLLLLIYGGIGASIIGMLVAFMRISPIGALRVTATAYTELVRNTPLTLVFFLIIIVLPVLQLGVPSFTGAIIALSVYTSPFVAEALRSGINGVPLGQAEAARSLGLNFSQTVFSIIMPQALRMVVPRSSMSLSPDEELLSRLGFPRGRTRRGLEGPREPKR